MDISLPLPDYDRLFTRQINNRRRFNPADAAIQDQIHLFTEFIVYLFRTGQGHVLTRQYQAGTEYRFMYFHQHGPGHRMIRYPDTDSLAFRVLETFRDIPGCQQQKGIRAGHIGLHQAKYRITDLCISCNPGKIFTHQCQIMFVVQLTNAPNTFQCILITNATAYGITGIRRIDHHAAIAQNVCRLPDQAFLRISRMNAEILCHIECKVLFRYDCKNRTLYTMKILFDFFPVLAFFIAYYLPADRGQAIYIATAVAIVAAIIQVAGYWLMTRRFEKMHLITLALIVILGTATLLLHDKRFFMWKPTAVNWLFALVFLGSEFFGKKNMLQRMMDHAITVPNNIWLILNRSWTVFFILMGALNLFVAFTFAENIWVNFKLFGMLGLTLLFAIGQSIYMSRYIIDTDEGKE